MFNFIILTNTKIIPSTATGAAAAPCAGARGWRVASPTASRASAIESGAVATVVAASATGSSDASRATAAGRASATAVAVRASATASVSAGRPAWRRLGPAPRLGSETR